MIILIEEVGQRLVFDGVKAIVEETKPSGRAVVYLHGEDGKLLVGGDDIDPTLTKITILPNAE